MASRVAAARSIRVREQGLRHTTYFGGWEVVVLDEGLQIEKCRLWGIFATEEEARAACVSLPRDAGEMIPDAHRF